MPPLPQASYGQLGPGEIRQLHRVVFVRSMLVFGGIFDMVWIFFVGAANHSHCPTVKKYFRMVKGFPTF